MQRPAPTTRMSQSDVILKAVGETIRATNSSLIRVFGNELKARLQEQNEARDELSYALRSRIRALEQRVEIETRNLKASLLEQPEIDALLEDVWIQRIRGEWNAQASYSRGDLVSHQRGLFAALKASTGEPPSRVAWNGNESAWLTLIPIQTRSVRGEPGQTGDRGLPGDSGGSKTIELAASVSESTVIAYDSNGKGIPADHRDHTAMTVQGIAASDGDAGDVISLRIVPFNWTLSTLSAGQSLFLGENGILTTTAPSTGYIRQIAIAINADTVIADIGTAYYLGT